MTKIASAGSGEIDFAVAAIETVGLGDPERACCANKWACRLSSQGEAARARDSAQSTSRHALRPCQKERHMAYHIAGIDVHKRMLAVVVVDVDGRGEWTFARRRFESGSRCPNNLRHRSR